MEKGTTYPNLRAEMARKNLTGTKIAKMIGVYPSAFSSKISGHRDFRLAEALAVKKVLGVDIPLEELFKK